MKQLRQVFLLGIFLVLSFAQGLTFEEKIIPLHTRLAGIGPDGITAYTEILYLDAADNYPFNKIFEAYNIESHKVKRYSTDGKSYSEKQYKLSQKNNRDSKSLGFYLCYPQFTGRPFLANAKMDADFALQFELKFWGLYQKIKNTNYLYSLTNYKIAIINGKTLKPITSFNTIEGIQDDGEGPQVTTASTLINNRMNRLLAVNDMDVRLYKIDFSHLPKNFNELVPGLLYGSNTHAYLPPALEARLTGDPKDKKGDSFTGTVNSLSLSPDDHWAAGAVANKDNNSGIQAWVRSMDTGLLKYVIRDQVITVTHFSPDGRYLLTAGYGEYCIRNANTGKTLLKIPINSIVSDNTGFAFSKDGKLLFSDSNFNLHVISIK